MRDEDIDSGFVDEVRGFLRDHWPMPPFRRVPAPVWEAAANRWFAALCRRGWSVPAWPEAYGGTGWSLEQRFVWERAVALAQAPAMDPVGVRWVGPLVQAHGGDALRERYLDDIRTARSRWADALGGLSLGDEDLRVRHRGSRHALQGSLTAIGGLPKATHALCLAAMDGGSGVFAVALASAGVRRIDARTLAFAGAEADLLSPPGAGIDALDAVLCADQASVAVTAAVESSLVRVKAGLGETADGHGGFLEGDAGFKRRLADLEVRLSALRGLEASSLAHRSKGNAPGVQAAMLELGCAELAQSLGGLMSEAAGYYALPQPDPLLTDNEGPIGPGYALPSLEGMLAPHWALEAHRRRLAAQLAG